MSSQIHRLNASQKVLFDKRKNVFFTGCAGTGKSFVLKRIVDALQSIHSKSGAIAVTASTGKAAFNIAGST
jgi:ATP-dependent DNA helicase PIF1